MSPVVKDKIVVHETDTGLRFIYQKKVYDYLQLKERLMEEGYSDRLAASCIALEIDWYKRDKDIKEEKKEYTITHEDLIQLVSINSEMILLLGNVLHGVLPSGVKNKFEKDMQELAGKAVEVGNKILESNKEESFNVE